MKFGVLHLSKDASLPDASNDDAYKGNELIAISPTAPALWVTFLGDAVSVRLAPVADEVWSEAVAIRDAVNGKLPQVSLSKLRGWVGQITFPMFVYRAGQIATLPIPRMDQTVIEVGAFDAGNELGRPPQFAVGDTIELSAWVKEHFL